MSPPILRQAVVLVGGRGTRLGELARDTPKPLMPIDGDRRFLDYLLDNLARHGLEEILLVAGHLGDQIEDRYQGRRIHGAQVVVIREPEAAGTGGALVHVADRLDEVFLMSNGDSWFDFNYLALAAALGPNDEAALALRQVEDARRFGRVEHQNGRVLAFHEKDESLIGQAWISGGVYLLRRSVLERIKALPCSIEAQIFPALASEGRLGGALFDGYFIDIGLPDTLAQAQAEIPAAARRPAVLFDRDGTLNLDAGYTHKVEDLRWTPGAIDAVRAVNDAGRLCIVVTNQAGLGRGLYSEDDMHRFHTAMQRQLMAAGAHVDAFYYCPFHAEATIEAWRHPDHPDRKPNPGMIEKALSDWPVERTDSVLIGDRDLDIEAARRAGVRGVLYEGGDLAALTRSAISQG